MKVIKFLIEDTRTQEWMFLDFNALLKSSPSVNTGWTNDANFAWQFDTFKKAKEHRDNFYNSPEYQVTEHQFG